MTFVSNRLLSIVPILTIAVFALASPAIPAIAQSPASPDDSTSTPGQDESLKRDVQRWLRQLDSDSLVEREAAEKELIAMGTKITAHLPPVNRRLSAEAASRLQRIRTSLDQAAIESRVGGGKISLEGNVSLKKTLTQLETLGEVRFEADQITDEEVQIDLKDAPFWKALDTLLDTAKMDMNLYGDKNSLDLFPNVRQVTRGERTAYTGAFRAEPTMIELSRDLSSNNSGRMSLAVQIAWEPMATPIFMNIPSKSIRATLDNGTELTAINPLANPEFTPVEGTLATEVSLQFAAPPRDCDQIKEVSMEVVALLPGSLQTFRFEELETNEEVKLKHGDLTIVLEPIRKSGEFAEFQMSMLLNDPNGVFDSYRGWVLNKEAYVLDPKGKRLENQGFHTRRLADNEVGISYLFEIPEDRQGYVFVYEIPGSVVKKTIPLQMKNIPLP
jgi:hypothetical protein